MTSPCFIRVDNCLFFSFGKYATNATVHVDTTTNTVTKGRYYENTNNIMVGEDGTCSPDRCRIRTHTTCPIITFSHKTCLNPKQIT